VKKDIEIHIAKDVYVAVIYEWNDEFLSKDWNVYILNNRSSQIDMVLVVTKGFDGDRKTSTMRHAIGQIEAKSFEKIETILDDVLALNNEFFVTYFADDKLYEKRFTVAKNTVSEDRLVQIPILEKEGVWAQ